MLLVSWHGSEGKRLRRCYVEAGRPLRHDAGRCQSETASVRPALIDFPFSKNFACSPGKYLPRLVGAFCLLALLANRIPLSWLPMPRVNIYVDGESHFIRTEQAWKEFQGDKATLETIGEIGRGGAGYTFPAGQFSQPYFDRRCKFFWDPLVTGRYEHATEFLPQHAVYFSSMSGDEETLHHLRLKIRSAQFEPRIIKERADLANRRANQLADAQILDKPKGVDIATAIRILEDAYRNLFDRCLLFTSDIDYLPVIAAIQQLGKKVAVFGYKQGLGTRSDLEYVPDHFVDLNRHIQTWYKPREQPAG